MLKILPLATYYIAIFYLSGVTVLNDFNVWDKIERFGLPTVLLLIIVYFAHNQNERRMREQREFWSDNNSYLRMLLNETRSQKDTCKFEK